MWDAFQREALGAMGHTLLVPVASRAVGKAAAAASPPAAPASPPAAPASPPASLAGADAGSAARPALLRALALAAGFDDTPPGSGHRDIGQYIALPSLADLRTPVAKRSLWPRLRALRKTPPA